MMKIVLLVTQINIFNKWRNCKSTFYFRLHSQLLLLLVQMLMHSMDMDMDILMPMDMFLLDPALVWTPSPKVWTQWHKDMFHTMDIITWARDPLMLMPTTLVMDTHTPMPMPMLPHMPMDIFLMPMDMCHLDPALVLTQSLRDWTQLPRDLSTKMTWLSLLFCCQELFNLLLLLTQFSDTGDVVITC